MVVRTPFFAVSVCALLFLGGALPSASATVPAITAFDEAFARVSDYTLTVHAHEVKGGQTQDRVYLDWFKKPHQMKTQILSGPGAGGGAVWTGGDTVSGHQGGILAFIHLRVGIHDGRATSLRGYTIPDGMLSSQVDKYTTIKGTLSERGGPDVDGQPTTQVELRTSGTGPEPDVARYIIYFSKTSHFPLEQVRYSADGKIVSLETWTNLKTNVGLKDSDF